MTAIISRDYPLPLYISPKQKMTDEELLEFCSVNNHLRIERDEHDQLIIMAPTGGVTGNQHSEINYAIQHWNRQKGLGKVFDSATGFHLPDTSMRSPDAAWISIEKWDSVSTEARKRFLPFAPDFLVEVLSPSDDFLPTQEKMYKWIQNGARLAWLIVPGQQTVFIYRADSSVDKVQGFDKKLSGENVLPDFEFDLWVLL
ncbi:MAG TPA: Uma2 family endonuclease [Flavisolibacter sp.]|nr:Uma2 family endonuclease [Flavisolibacter sp.]